MPARRPLTMRARTRIKKAVTYVVLIVGSLSFLFPLAWMVSTSLKEQSDVYTYPITWIPDPIDWANYVELFQRSPFALYLWNTVVITFFGVAGTLIGSSIAAYAFARMRFRGRDAMFYIMLATMMIPSWATLIPTYVLFARIGWLDTYLPIIVPAFFAAPFATFLLRQFFLTIPVEMEEAARIDGAGRLRIFLTIVLPLSKPALLMVGIFAFLAFWNDFLSPLIYLQSRDKFPLSVGLRYFVTEYTSDYPLLMAGSLIALAPCVIIFLIAQKWFIQGIVVSGLKG